MAENRHAGIDRWKTVAAVSVILLHATVTQAAMASSDRAVLALQTFNQWGVPFFMVASGYFEGQSLGSAGGKIAKGWASRRTVRLLGPYLAWTCVYLIFNALVSVAGGSGIPAWNPVSVVVFGGAEPALWYLPAMLYAGIIVAFVDRRAVLPLALLADMAFFMLDHPITNNIFISRFPLAVALTALGFHLSRTGPPGSRNTRIAALGAVILLTMAASTEFMRGTEVVLHPILTGLLEFVRLRFPWAAGSLLFIAATGTPHSAPASGLSNLSRYGLGVYLVHMLILKTCALVVPPDKIFPLAWVAGSFAVATVGSFLAVRGLSRNAILWRFIS